MKVCIAEKPSVAKEIAEIVGAKTRHDGFYEGNGYQVTWTFGHLCTLKEPHEYTPDWKSWRLELLPMIPARFGIKLIDDKGYQKQFRTIERLMQAADEVINCGDAGQEGELIQRWVMQKAGVRCPVYRLWISSLTDEAIRDGFAHLQPQADFNKLYEAGLSRAIGDWLLGMNATRLYTLRYGRDRQVLSIGRVQTPTLALIVRRQLEIDNFVPQQYWELKTVYRDVTFNATKGRFATVEEGRQFLANVEGYPFTVTDVTKKNGRESAPRLFDLTALQVECNKKFGYSADETLRIIQSLYEKKVTTYPRVDTTFLSDDIYPKCPGIMQALTGYQQLTANLPARLPKSKKVFDNSKVTDHHAIIPTNVRASGLTDMEWRVYDLVARRFIAVFYPDCLVALTTVMGEVCKLKPGTVAPVVESKVEFKATGKQILDPGWRVVYGADRPDENDKEKEGDEERTLPDFVKGESGPHTPSLLEKWTQPPKPYTEATLLRAMETAGKLVDDEELRDALKENGIGRPSTRAAIIETLFKRKYIRKERKNLVATPTGIDLIGIIQEELLKSAELTGIWENKLRRIERSEYEAAEFLGELKQMVAQIVWNVRNDHSNRMVSVVSDVPVKKVIEAKAARRANTTAASASSKPDYGAAVNAALAADAAANAAADAAKGKSSTAEGKGEKKPRKPRASKKDGSATASKKGASKKSATAGEAAPTASDYQSPQSIQGSQSSQSTSSSQIPQPAPLPPGIPTICPLCGKGTIIRGRTAYGCSEWRSGCNFRIPFETK